MDLDTGELAGEMGQDILRLPFHPGGQRSAAAKVVVRVHVDLHGFPPNSSSPAASIVPDIMPPRIGEPSPCGNFVCQHMRTNSGMSSDWLCTVAVQPVGPGIEFHCDNIWSSSQVSESRTTHASGLSIRIDLS